jgi:hypothetical protein
MKNISYGVSVILALFATTLMVGTVSTGSVVGQTTTGTMATGNVTSGAATTETESLSVTIFSKTTGKDYVYNDINTQQELINAINEVETLTHPESIAAEETGPLAMFADQSTQQLAAEIFTVASVSIPAGEDDDPQAEWWSPWKKIKQAAKWAWNNKDTIITVGKGAAAVFG